MPPIAEYIRRLFQHHEVKAVENAKYVEFAVQARNLLHEIAITRKNFQ